MANTDMSVELMIFEGGALIAALPSNIPSEHLAEKIERADQEALAAGNTSFTLTVNPIELGIGFEAAARGDSPLSQSIAQKFRRALEAKMNELGISYGQNQPSGGLNQPAPEPEPAPAEDSGDLNVPSVNEDEEAPISNEGNEWD